MLRNRDAVQTFVISTPPCIFPTILSAIALKDNSPTMSSADTEEQTLPSAHSATATGGFFKKRAKTTSVQKGLRRPPYLSSSAPTKTSIPEVESEDEDYGSEDERGSEKTDIVAGKKRKRGGVEASSSGRPSGRTAKFGVSYDINRSVTASLDPRNQATAVSAEFSETELLAKKGDNMAQESTSDNLYRGQKNYRELVPKREQITTKYNAMGPQKAASNIRMTTVVDYAPGMSLTQNSALTL
jgi:hypothetical protein